MPTRTTNWPAGTPNWVDCSFDHMHRAKDFYAKLFGWEIREGGDDMGGYAVGLKHHHAAAGLAPRMQPDVPSAWSTFFASDDVDATAGAIRDAGGRTLVEPMDVPNAGRMAFFLDPEGAAFGVWQGGEHPERPGSGDFARAYDQRVPLPIGAPTEAVTNDYRAVLSDLREKGVLP